MCQALGSSSCSAIHGNLLIVFTKVLICEFFLLFLIMCVHVYVCMSEFPFPQRPEVPDPLGIGVILL